MAAVVRARLNSVAIEVIQNLLSGFAVAVKLVKQRC